MISFTNLREVAEAVRALPGKHEAVEAEALFHQSQLTKPPGALGRLEELAVFLASWQGQVKPSLTVAQAAADPVAPQMPSLMAVHLLRIQSDLARLISSCTRERASRYRAAASAVGCR